MENKVRPPHRPPYNRRARIKYPRAYDQQCTQEMTKGNNTWDRIRQIPHFGSQSACWYSSRTRCGYAAALGGSKLLTVINFPDGIRRRVKSRYPHLTETDLDRVFSGLRQYF